MSRRGKKVGETGLCFGCQVEKMHSEERMRDHKETCSSCSMRHIHFPPAWRVLAASLPATRDGELGPGLAVIVGEASEKVDRSTARRRGAAEAAVEARGASIKGCHLRCRA